MSDQPYKRRPISREEIVKLEEQARDSWQGDLVAMVSGEIDGFHVEPGDQERFTEEDLRKKTHHLFNAIQYKLTKGSQEAECDYRDFIKAMRGGNRVTVYRRVAPDGTLIPIPDRFRHYILNAETRTSVTLKKTGARLGKSFSSTSAAQAPQGRKAG